MKKEGILYSTGQLDCLSYYSKIFSKIKKFVGDRELATKTFIPESIPPFIVHRGSNSPKLTLSNIKVTQLLLNKRVGKKLHQVEKELTEQEKLVWRYFVPRKINELFYACNYESPGKPFDRVFIDIDASKGTSESTYLNIIRQLLKEIRSDKELRKIVSFKIYLLWTGASIHVYLLLNKKLSANYYTKYFSFGKSTLTSKWAKNISEKLKTKVKAGHERTKGATILDTSATPSGKLARCPYSLHFNSKGKLNGVSVPIKESMLKPGLFNKLKNLTPNQALTFSQLTLKAPVNFSTYVNTRN